MRRELAMRVLGTVAAWALCILTFLLVAPRAGPGAASLVTIPALVAGYLLGWRGGLIMLPVTLVVSELLLSTLGRPLEITLSDMFYASLAAAIAATVGWVQGIRAKLRDAVREAREIAERYQLVTRATNDVVRDWDLRPDVLWWSENFQHTFGHEIVENPTAPASWISRIHPEDRARVLASVLAAIGSPADAQWHDDYRFQRRDGSYAFVSDRGFILRDSDRRATRMLGSMHDVSSSVEAERALQQSAASFRTLFENVPIGLYRTTPSGRILLANPALVSLLGYASFDELSDRDLNQDLEADYERSEFMAKVEKEHTLRNFLSTWTAKDGRRIPVREDVRLVRGPQGEPLYYEGSVEDLTERVRMENDAAEKQRLLERTEHLSALGTLVAGVAHEVNNPLAYIRGNVELDDLAGMELPEKARQAVRETEGKLGTALRGIDQLASIATSLKVVARRSEGVRTREDVDRLVRSVLLVAEARIPAAATVDLDLRAPRPVEVVSDQLTQVLLNLLLNSADAVRGRTQGHIVVRSFTQDDKTVIEVTDNGPGIAREDHAKIFVPFHTTKPEGTGLGLSLSYGIIESLGGKLTFESEPGEGTTFRIALPAVGAERARKAETPRIERVLSHRARSARKERSPGEAGRGDAHQ